MIRIMALVMALMTLFTASAETLRVRLRSLGEPEALHLTLAGDYKVEELSMLRLDDGAALTLYEDDGCVWLRSGGLRVNLGKSAVLARSGGTGLFIRETEKDTRYDGDLTVTADGGGLRTVLKMDLEDYLYGVVAYEMSNSFPIEALKAQAVAARTYAMQRKSVSQNRDYDVVDTTADQVFKGFDPQHERVIRAVDATGGTVCMYGGDYAACFYTASNGGQIARPGDVWGGGGDYGYIELKDDPYDLENPRSLVNSVSFRADLSDCAALKKLLKKALGGVQPVKVTAVEPICPEPEDSRRYTKVRFEVETADGGQATAELDVFSQLKDSLNLGLNGGDHELITAEETDEGFRLEMRRFGHGTGMSQRGAQWMAAEYDRTWEEILAFYYPGAEIVSGE